MENTYSFIRNKKGTLLITTYLIMLTLLGLTAAFYSQVFSQKKMAGRDLSGMEALYAAEAGIAFAYGESQNMAWDWYTHEDANTAAITSPVVRMIPASGSSPAIDGNGYYVYTISPNLTFKVKAYPDPDLDDVTIIRAMGISGTAERVIEYRLSRKSIYDYYRYSPYTISLSGREYNASGGRIHSNEDIRMGSGARVRDVSELSTGEDGSIYYAYNQYYRPGSYDRSFDRRLDGKAPLPDLGKPHRWAGTTADDDYLTQYPWKYWNTRSNDYRWKRFGYEAVAYWAPRPWRSVETIFTGNNEDVDRFKREIDGNELNIYNTWIRPYRTDEEGDSIEEGWREIPAELDQAWNWDKYYGNPIRGEQSLHYFTYDAEGNEINASDTHWQIVTDEETGKKKVVMTNDSAALNYWGMLQNQDYWRAIGVNDSDAKRWSSSLLNPEVFDGSFGSDEETMAVNNTNSKEQPDAWKEFLANSGLEGIVMDGNTGGQNIAPPRFATTYAQLAFNSGLYIKLETEGIDSVDEDADKIEYRSDPVAFWEQVENAIDAMVEELNDNEASLEVAKKVEFINNFTNERVIILEIDLEKIGQAGTTPSNGIIYSRVPVRVTNAMTLPGNRGIHIISEENVYLKGDFNSPANESDWQAATVISKKRIFTLSDNFNDPQNTPALASYLNYPSLYVAKDRGPSGEYAEANPDVRADGFWVYKYNLDSDGVADDNDSYPQINDQNERDLREAIDDKNEHYRRLFDKDDPSGNRTATFSWPRGGERYTWGYMPPKVENDATYNALLASYWGTDGEVLERWDYRNAENRRIRKNKIMEGAYFRLDRGDGAFTAEYGEGVDYYDIRYNERGRKSGWWIGRNSAVSKPPISAGYDDRFLSAAESQKPIFFGGAQDSWYEVSTAGF